MLVLELTLFRFRNNKGKPDISVISFFIIAVALPAALTLLYLVQNPGYITGGYSYRNFNLEERILTEGRVLIFYLKSILIPSVRELGLYHDDITISRGLFDPPTTLYSLMALGWNVAGGIAVTAQTTTGQSRHPLVFHRPHDWNPLLSGWNSPMSTATTWPTTASFSQ